MKSIKKLLAAFLVVFVTLGFTGKAEAGTITNAKEITFNKTYVVSLAAETPEFYKITLPRSGKIDVAFEGAQEISAWLYKADMVTQFGSWGSKYDENFGAYKGTCDANPLYGGVYYLKFRSNEASNLKFKVTYTDSNETFAETQDSSYDGIKTAKTIKAGTFYRGYFAGSGYHVKDDVDVYKIVIDKPATYTIFIRRWFDENIWWSNIPHVKVLDSNGNEIFKADIFDRTNDETQTSEVNLKKGTYYLRFECGNQYDYRYGFKVFMKKPVITADATNVKTINGSVGKFTVAASGDNLKYQWYVSKDGKKWTKSSAASATSATLSIRATKSLNGRKFKCIVSNDGGKVTSSVVTWKVLNIITKQPANKSVAAGKLASFTVTTRSSAAKYQWQISTDGGKTWNNSSATVKNDATAHTSTVSFVAKKSQSGYMYRCVVKSGTATEYTSKVKLTVK